MSSYSKSLRGLLSLLVTTTMLSACAGHQTELPFETIEQAVDTVFGVERYEEKEPKIVYSGNTVKVYASFEEPTGGIEHPAVSSAYHALGVAKPTELAGKEVQFILIANIRTLKRHPYEFYQWQGYTIVGMFPDTNGTGKPDIIMAKRLQGQRGE